MTFCVSIELPPGFELTHLISLDPDWQANLRSEEHVAIGTGETPLAAITAASHKAEAGQFIGRLFHLHYEPSEVSIPLSLASLGLRQSKPMKKRKL